MSIKDIQGKLKDLRDRIKDEGELSSSSEAELRALLDDTLISANAELDTVRKKLNAHMALRAGNDNIPLLTDEQKRRLMIVEKTGTGSHAVH